MVTVYLTAENPQYVFLPLRQDNARDYQLLHMLEERLLYPDRQIKMAQFVDNKTGYAEKAFRVSGISVKDAVELARIWNQEAIVVEGLGLLNVIDMTYHPIIKKYTGEAAYHRQMFTLLEGMPAVAYDFDFTVTKRYHK